MINVIHPVSDASKTRMEQSAIVLLSSASSCLLLLSSPVTAVARRPHQTSTHVSLLICRVIYDLAEASGQKRVWLLDNIWPDEDNSDPSRVSDVGSHTVVRTHTFTLAHTHFQTSFSPLTLTYSVTPS